MKWNLAHAPNNECVGKIYKTVSDIESAGFDIIPAAVPGCLELDLMTAEEIYFSANTLKVQEFENQHLWYFTRLTAAPGEYLRFEGIDTFADIYINGELKAGSDNMFLSVEVDLPAGECEIVVHIKPTMIEARKHASPAGSNALAYTYPSLYVRKAAHMFGWDIMPRIVSAGLWKEVKLLKRKPDRLKEVFFATHSVSETSAHMRFHVNAALSGDYARDYSVKVKGVCGGSGFSFEKRLWHNTDAHNFTIENPKLWNPRNYGDPNLYDTVVTLLYKGEVKDEYRLKVGVRTVELIRTDATDKDGNGDFCFKVNGKRVFVLGTNHVPLDAFHCNDPSRTEKFFELLDDIGCNALRCWGGNVYESDRFYDLCDELGIMVWQDFAMGCAVYPQDCLFAEKIEREATYQVKRLRNHPSVILYAGDNEGDICYRDWIGFRRDPGNNFITRQVLKRVCESQDYTRPYLPSSPFVSPAVTAGGVMPEEHLWGPRDYFKGAYYKDTFCHFASETGYHGFPSPESLRRFLREPEKIFNDDGTPTEEYLVHAASPETDPNAPFAYRIRLAYNQVLTLFGGVGDSLGDFVRRSQISQGEAKKYFIEKFRIGKPLRTGIIWWNLLDGWPQVSDAVADYYFTKKLAYHYIRRSQQPLCLMFDEPKDGRLTLFGVNDTTEPAEVEYKVTRVSDGETILKGAATIPTDKAVEIDSVPADDKKEFLLIEWWEKGERHINHYFTNVIEIDYNKYIDALKKCGMYEFEGFEL